MRSTHVTKTPVREYISGERYSPRGARLDRYRAEHATRLLVGGLAEHGRAKTAASGSAFVYAAPTSGVLGGAGRRAVVFSGKIGELVLLHGCPVRGLGEDSGANV